MRYQAPRGTQDLFPGRTHVWQELERRYFALAARYGYGEIRTPMFEEAALFLRTSGEESDIVQKEMYRFTDLGGRELALKPEGTAPTVRAAVDAKVFAPGAIHRYAYRTEIFRYGRQGRGRFRQAHQFGAELLGSATAYADAEVIELAMDACTVFGLRDAVVRVNSIGREETRREYGEALLTHLASYMAGLPEDQADRIRRHPLGVLDTKDPALQAAIEGAPSILGYLDPESAARFRTLVELLQSANVRFEIAPEIVRGLDYYTETVFEIVSPSLPGLSIAGGGRYDDLVREIGGPPTPAAGFGIGIERVILCLEELGALPVAADPLFFVVSATPDAVTEVRNIVRHLRSVGHTALHDLEVRSLKSQLRQANASGARYAILIGEDEKAANLITVRDLAASAQTTMTLTEFLAQINSYVTG